MVRLIRASLASSGSLVKLRFTSLSRLAKKLILMMIFVLGLSSSWGQETPRCSKKKKKEAWEGRKNDLWEQEN